ncbi:hypothetical protein Lal_00006280 [Lupinus albus]|nr:hypothetical protein Lal_00006280 [Lupinus albus]
MLHFYTSSNLFSSGQRIGIDLGTNDLPSNNQAMQDGDSYGGGQWAKEAVVSTNHKTPCLCSRPLMKIL